MSRTTLCVGTAAVLILSALGTMGLRYAVLGSDVTLPSGPETWKVSLVVQGKSQGETRLVTRSPVVSSHQHVLKESTRSEQFHAKVDSQREIHWSKIAGTPDGVFRLSYECFVALTSRDHLPPEPAPPAGKFVRSDALIDSDHPELAMHARQLTDGLESPSDKASELFAYVDQQVENEPSIASANATAIDCFQVGRGDALAKARLLVALLRNRDIPARVVVGLPLVRGSFRQTHYWAEAYLRGHWLPMCPTYHHYGRVPRTWLEFGRDDDRVVHSKNARDLEAAFLVEPVASAASTDPSWSRQFFTAFSPFALPPAERHLVEFLLLLPVAALIVCVSRNVIGLTTFGTFTPALLGLAFRELNGMVGVMIFVGILLMGWVLRRMLNRFHLLQVPRLAVMLTLVVGLLIAFIVIAHAAGAQATHYVSLFPLVILTGMIERFWTLEEEDGTAASFRTLFSTLLVAVAISLVLARPLVLTQMTCYPETLGIILALQLLIGRYTGYRLIELYRFRDFIRQRPGMAVSEFRFQVFD